MIQVPKKLFNPHSKTHLWALLQAITGALVIALPEMRAALTPTDYAIAVGVVTVVNITLRNITTTPIDQK